MPSKKGISILLLVLVLLGAGASCAPARDAAMDRTEYVLGTICSVRILSGASKAALDAAFKRLAEIESTMSANAAGTVVHSINLAAGIAPVKAPDDVRHVTRKALLYTQLSNGAFDPTVGPLVKLWNIGLEGERVPDPAEILAALPLVDAGSVRIDDEEGTIFLSRPGMLLDLGGIAKGYAADEVGRILLSRGVKAAVIDLGGNVKVVGQKPDKSRWRIGVQNPFDARGSYIGIATLEGEATVVTSGIYERYFIDDDGRNYHHIIDTRTGYPVVGDLVSVTIISTSSVDADGLSTAIFAMGLDAGMALVEELEHIEAVFIDHDKTVRISSGLPGAFTITDKTFILTAKP